eukprot:scaffold20224_cov138-Isochrysis_galbana.AAC.3
MERTKDTRCVSIACGSQKDERGSDPESPSYGAGCSDGIHASVREVWGIECVCGVCVCARGVRAVCACGPNALMCITLRSWLPGSSARTAVCGGVVGVGWRWRERLGACCRRHLGDPSTDDAHERVAGKQLRGGASAEHLCEASVDHHVGIGVGEEDGGPIDDQPHGQVGEDVVFAQGEPDAERRGQDEAEDTGQKIALHADKPGRGRRALAWAGGGWRFAKGVRVVGEAGLTRTPGLD